MSQYPQQGPSPYSPLPPQQPGYYYGADPYDELLAPARRASIMIYVLGALMVIGAFCCGAFGIAVPMDEIFAQRPELLQQNPGLTADMVQTVFVVLGVISMFAGVAFLVLGYFVRSGGMGAVITGIALCSLAVIMLLIYIVATVTQLQGARAAELMFGLCVLVIPLALFGLLLGWLIQAARNAPRVQSMQAQYQMQYWQHQQQQQQAQQQPQPGGSHAGPQQQQQQRPPSTGG